MTAQRKSNNSPANITQAYRVGSGGTRVAIANGWRVGAGGARIKIWPTTPPITITGNTLYASSGAVGGFPRTKSATTALSVSGGTGSYSYAWTQLSGDTISVSNTTTLNPTFSKSLSPNTGTVSTYRLTVTSGSVTATYDVSINLTN